ncbi:MAG: IreB family regulatory phosphoprotein [Lachnospiraceae bacterium]|nr:IreB family regulatory phosphoprotein [Lachnospiraceae bacterium]
MAGMKETQSIDTIVNQQVEVSQVLETVCAALKAKGYNPIGQLVGYILSGDPTYITSFNGARSMIQKVERDEILDELIQFYISEKMD